jgi:hypothetical protein
MGLDLVGAARHRIRISTPLPPITEHCFGGSMTGVQSKGMLSSLRYGRHIIAPRP